MSVFSDKMNRFSGVILETGEKVCGQQEFYRVQVAGIIGTNSKFLLANRLQKLYPNLFYTLILDNMKKYEVYINDRGDALIQRDVDTRWMRE